MTRRPWLAIFAALAVAVAWAGVPAHAQDLQERRGFRVEIMEPRSGDIVQGPMFIRVDVTEPREGDVERVTFEVNDRRVFVDTDPPWQVEYDFGSQRKQHVIRVVAHHRDGPTVSDFVITRTLDLQYTVNVKRVILDVSVRDSDRRPVLGLQKDDFAVKEDGRAQSIEEVTREERALLVGVLVDTSGSMRDRLEQAQQAACGFLETLRPQDRVFVVDFDENVFLVEETTSDFDAACSAIRTTYPVGGTALYDAIHAAYRVIYQPKAERRALIVLSDGDDTESRLTFEEIEEEALLSDVTVYAIGLDVGGMGAARRHLDRLTRITGGRAYFVRKADDLGSAYEQIALELRTLYQLTYASDNETFDGRLIEVEVNVTRPGRYDIRHRQGYYAAEDTP